MGNNSYQDDIKQENAINESNLNNKKNINLKGMLEFASIAENGICKIIIPNGYGSGFFTKIHIQMKCIY